MKWVTTAVVGTWLSLFAATGTAQEFSPEPCSNTITGNSSCQLIAWSAIQNPQPEPPAGSHGGQPEQQPTPQKSRTAASQVELTGVVVKQGGRCFFEVGHSLYELDDQPKTAPYEGRPTRILGNLAEGRKIQIMTIETLP